MLGIKFIRQNVEEVKKSIADSGMNVDVDELLGLDDKRRVSIQKIGESRAVRNKTSNTKPSPEDIAKMRTLGDEISKMEKELKNMEVYYLELIRKVPNMIHPDSPRGGEEAFKVVGEYGKIPKFNFQPKDHEESMLKLNLIDFERGAKVAGAK